jgi:hypothetical protein
MGHLKLGLAAFAAGCLLAAVSPEPAQAMAPQPLMLRGATAPMFLVAQEGSWFHHGKRVQSAYCLRRNYWWFYRPYTTAAEDFPRCEPYFHYLEPPYGRRGARTDPYFK